MSAQSNEDWTTLKSILFFTLNLGIFLVYIIAENLWIEWVNDILLKIKECFKYDKALFSKHARFEMKFDEFGQIFVKDIDNLINSSEIIEFYSNDKPYPSYLLLGFSDSKPIHIVIAYSEEDDRIIIITVYRPNPELWIDFKIRKKKWSV